MDHTQRKLSRLLAVVLASALLLSAGAPFIPTAAALPAGPTATYLLQGRVYAGDTGIEGTPLEGVTVELWLGNNPYPDPGTWYASTTTNAAGWYGFSIDSSLPWEFFKLRQINPSGYTSDGARSVGGSVRTADWIEFVVPLQGQDLSGNKFWDQPPPGAPQFTSGPMVVDNGPDYALVSWATDYPATSWVDYDHLSGVFSHTVGTNWLSNEHQVQLNGLSPSTTYHLRARSGYPGGGEATSGELTFRTSPLPDSVLPSIQLLDPGTITTTATITATASDNQGVAQVFFSIDGTPVFIDYSPPYTYSFDSTDLGNGQHTFSAGAIDLIGNQQSDSLPASVANLVDSSAPQVTITQPTQNATVSGKTDVRATLSDDTGLVSARFYVDGDYRQFKSYNISSPPTSDVVTFTWDTRGEANGGYRLAVQIYDLDGKQTTATRDVVVNNTAPPPPPSPPWLDVQGHSVARNGNRFAILLSVKNTGDAAARNVRVLDGLRGFQPIETRSANADILTEYNPAGGFAYADMHVKGEIAPGETRLFIYNAVAFMLNPKPATPAVGYFVDLSWDSATNSGYHNYVQLPVAQTSMGETIPQAHAQAVKSADYLLVTNPYRLFALYNPAYYQGASQQRTQVNQLLSAMAELAFYKQGALGYNTVYTSESLRDLVKSGGKWSSALSSGWASNGYMLIVGEVEVVSAWWRYYGSQLTSRGNTPFITSYTDYPYASTFGDEIRPQLSMGRIIGNNAYWLRRPLETAINLYEGQSGYGYKGQQKLVANGFDRCMSGGCDEIHFQTEVDNVVKVLAGPIIGLRTPNLAVYDSPGHIDITATHNAITTTFFANSGGKDIIFLAGHGNGTSWDAINVNDIHAQSQPFGSSNPFVFASSCDTAHYPTGTSLAEAFLNRRAGAYMGAINFGACYTNHTCPHADTFFSKWSQGKAFATALRDAKNAIGSSFFDRYWAGIYHLFGDAKFGAPDTIPSQRAAAAPAAAAPASPSGQVEVPIPPYEISSENGEDVVTIPGGQPLMEPGRPAVPAYRVQFEYPAGTQVQDVSLLSSAPPEIIPDLNVFTTTLAIPGGEVLAPKPSAAAASAGYWPAQDFSWLVYESPLTTTLQVTFYPFSYDPASHTGKYTSSYQLDISTASSELELTTLSTTRAVVSPGEPLEINLALQNQGPSQDVIVEAVIQEAAAGSFTQGLILETLQGLVGPASFQTIWDTTGVPPGDYTVVVELRDPYGTLLDRGQTSFQVGVRAAEVANLSITPASLDPGGSVNLALDLTNSGQVSLDAIVVFQVQGGTISETVTLERDVLGLTPAEATHVSAALDTTGLPGGIYQVSAFARYLGKASDVLAGSISLNSKLYLPRIAR